MIKDAHKTVRETKLAGKELGRITTEEYKTISTSAVPTTLLTAQVVTDTYKMSSVDDVEDMEQTMRQTTQDASSL